jgi:tRNA threonylcarbamoyladenosine biosynthesis protein TsaB
MIVLAIDTCGPTGSIALGKVEGRAVSLVAQTELAGKTYSSQIVPALRSLLSAQNLTVADIAAIVVVNGPGSFTGVRIGVSSAKGFAEALRIPVLAVSRLAVLASKAGVESAALDAGRSEFYLRNESHEALIPSKHLHSPAPRPIAVCEPGALRVFSDAILVDPPTAADALTFATARLLTRDFADFVTLDANYLRRSDAEIFAKTSGKP